jgi:hypothetical protein
MSFDPLGGPFDPYGGSGQGPGGQGPKKPKHSPLYEELMRKYGFTDDMTIYIDLNGGIHKTAEGALSENLRIESDYTRSRSGGCPQDPSKATG